MRGKRGLAAPYRWRPQPGHVPWWGINEPTTFRCVWTTPNQLRHTGQGQINFEPINSHIQLHYRVRTTLIFPIWTSQPPVCLLHITWLAFVNSHCEVNTALCFFTTLLLQERAASLRKAQRSFRQQNFNVGWGFKAGVGLEINQLQNGSTLTIKIFIC